MIWHQESDTQKMAKFLFCFTLLFCALGHAKENLAEFATHLDVTLRSLNSHQSLNCNPSKTRTSVSSKKVHLQDDEVSVLSEADAQKLFSELKSNADIPFEFSVAGCEERAHEMSRLMLLKGITPLKVFASVDENESPRLRRPNPMSTGMTVDWKYHVAPVVLVKKGTKLVPFVMDPSLEKKAVSVSEWRNTMTRHDPKMKANLSFTKAAQYDNGGRIIVNFKDNDFNSSVKATLLEYKERSKSEDGESQLFFELQRDYERMLMYDQGG